MRKKVSGLAMMLIRFVVLIMTSLPSFAGDAFMIGRVTDDVTALGVEYAAVEIKTSDGKVTRTAVTDRAGLFSLAKLPAKAVTVTISKLHYSRFPTIRELTLTNGANVCDVHLIRDDADEAYYRLEGERIIYDVSGKQPDLSRWDELESSPSVPQSWKKKIAEEVDGRVSLETLSPNSTLLFYAHAGKAFVIPSGTRISVERVGKINPQAEPLGQDVFGILTEPITVQGSIIAPEGARAVLKVRQVGDGFKGSVPGLRLNLVAVEVEGSQIAVVTDFVGLSYGHGNALTGGGLFGGKQAALIDRKNLVFALTKPVATPPAK